jgi:hypothetical protein
MSYLAQPTSTTEYGVVKVGSNIEVSTDGIISLIQDLSPGADVNFNTVWAGEVYDDGDRVVTSVNPNAGPGISITAITSSGPTTEFTVNNTGVLKLTAGDGISLSANTGNITISSYGADLINVYGTTTNYTATLNDEYIGVSSTNNIIITLPTGVDGRVYIIKDEYGTGSGKITIQPQANVTIDNKPNYIISTPNQSVQVVYRAGKWWIM